MTSVTGALPVHERVVGTSARRPDIAEQLHEAWLVGVECQSMLDDRPRSHRVARREVRRREVDVRVDALRLGTKTLFSLPCSSFCASWPASRRSVFTRSPGARSTVLGATTTTVTPRSRSAHAIS